VILNSKVTASLDANPPSDSHRSGIYLGRPWRPYARVVVMNTDLPAAIRPEGWNNWNNPANEKTAWFAEFRNTGPGASSDANLRAPWSHQLPEKDARQFRPEIFLAGSDRWNPIAEAARLP